jgi:hypothetical protein
VTLPSGTAIVVESTISTVLGKVTIPVGSVLLFAENPNGISVNSRGFNVLGKLIAGSETCRYATRLTITLNGQRASGITSSTHPNSVDRAFKGISVTGALELHGKRFSRTWTR